MKRVKLFGSGCSRCLQTAEIIKKEAAALGIDVEIEKISDLTEIAQAGITATPAVMIEDRLVHAGGLPIARAVRDWLQRA